MRILSLLPSTTEIASALGFEKNLIGRSHECDFPIGIKSLPALTRPKYKPGGNSFEIDKKVKSLLQNGLSVYEVDADLLAELKPDIILTQDHCEVCAVSLPDVELALRNWTGSNTKIVSVSPVDLNGIYQSFLTIGTSLNAKNRALDLISHIKQRMEIIKNTVLGEKRKSVVSVEWISPVMTAGNWIPELTEIAGGNPLLAETGKHSPWVEWEIILKSNPDILVLMPCGYPIQQTADEFAELTSQPGWNKLKAVQKNQVYLLEGNQFFNRPGPRIFESTRIMAEILHPQLFKPLFRNSGWIRVDQLRKMPEKYEYFP